MLFHNESFSDAEVVSAMEQNGYNTLSPAIKPEVLRGQCEHDPVLLGLYEQMVKQCQAYSHDVFSMMHEQKVIEEMRMRGEDTIEAMSELRNIDELRHHSHESLMDSINILSRALAGKDIDISWMREVSSGGRATYAIFALLTFYTISVTMK